MKTSTEQYPNFFTNNSNVQTKGCDFVNLDLDYTSIYRSLPYPLIAFHSSRYKSSAAITKTCHTLNQSTKVFKYGYVVIISATTISINAVS